MTANDILANLKPVPAPDDMLLDNAAVAAAILKARLDLGLLQKTVALEMGISQPYLKDLEHGHRRWSLKLFNDAKAAMERLTQS